MTGNQLTAHLLASIQMVPGLLEIRSRSPDTLNTHSTTEENEGKQESSSVEPTWRQYEQTISDVSLWENPYPNSPNQPNYLHRTCSICACPMATLNPFKTVTCYNCQQWVTESMELSNSDRKTSINEEQNDEEEFQFQGIPIAGENEGDSEESWERESWDNDDEQDSPQSSTSSTIHNNAVFVIANVNQQANDDLAFMLGPRKDGVIQYHTPSLLHLTPNYYRHLDNSQTPSSDTENKTPDLVPHAALAYLRHSPPAAPISHAQRLFRSWNLRRQTSKRHAQAENEIFLDNLVADINSPHKTNQPTLTPTLIPQGVTVLLPKATRTLPPHFSIPGTPPPDNWIPPPDRELLSLHHVFPPIEHPTNKPITGLTCAEIVRREFLWTRIRKRFARKQKKRKYKRKYKPRYKRTIITIEHEFTNDDTHTSPSVSPTTTISPNSPNRNIQLPVSQPTHAAYEPRTTRTNRTQRMRQKRRLKQTKSTASPTPPASPYKLKTTTAPAVPRSSIAPLPITVQRWGSQALNLSHDTRQFKEI
jgi:hypothetical protein